MLFSLSNSIFSTLLIHSHTRAPRRFEHTRGPPQKSTRAPTHGQPSIFARVFLSTPKHTLASVKIRTTFETSETYPQAYYDVTFTVAHHHEWR